MYIHTHNLYYTATTYVLAGGRWLSCSCVGRGGLPGA